MTQLKAPEGKFRVVGVDTFSHDDWVQGDFDTKEKALECARYKSGTMLKMYVYDDKGKYIDGHGSY